MNKRILSLALALLMCLSALSFPAAAIGATVSASYSSGVVTVSGTGFANSYSYTVRVVNASNASIIAMKQVDADETGNLSASIITGALDSSANYTVYVNNADGTCAASVSFTVSTSSGDIGGGGGSSGDSSSTTTSTSDGITTTNTTVTGTTLSGITSSAITSSIMEDLIDTAQDAESAGYEAIVKINVTTTSSTKSVMLTIPGAELADLADKTDAAVTVNTTIGMVTFDADAVASISDQAGSCDVVIAVEKVDVSTLSDELQGQIGNRPVYDFSVTADGRTFSSFGGGHVSISIPYALAAGEDENAVIVFYIDDSGEMLTVRGAYNASTDTVNFSVAHFSKYGIGYNEVSFSDIGTGDWYAEAVIFIAARGITTGTEEDVYSPEATLTRAQFLVMLMRAYGLEPANDPSVNFADAGNYYYTNYLAAAKTLGITTGIGDNNFAPEHQISRQDMFTLLYRALNVLGELPDVATSETLSNFSDSAAISDYATDAFTTFVAAGIVSGSDGMLNPAGQSTRAQMAQVLYNLLSK